jgi:hypothetical protein
MTNTGLVNMCTRNEWYIIGLIMAAMFEYNALWKVDVDQKHSNSRYRLGVNGLVRKNILIATEVAHLYIVNPVHLRRGDPFTVTATTANMLMNRKPTDEMLCDKRPVHSFDFSRRLDGPADL